MDNGHLKNIPRDILIVLLLAVLSVPVILLTPGGNSLRIVLAIPIVFLLPGYALVLALWPRRKMADCPEIVRTLDMGNLRSLERIAISVGMSIFIVIMLGLAISYSDHSLNMQTVLTLSTIFTIAASIIAWFRMLKVPEVQRSQPDFSEVLNLFNEDKYVTIGVILVAICVIASAYSVYNLDGGSAGYSEFYITKEDGTLFQGVVNNSAGEPFGVTIGVISHELNAMSYSINVALQNESGVFIREIYNESFSLSSGGLHETSMLVNFTETGKHLVSFELHVAGNDGAYNRLHLWVQNPETVFR